MTRRIYSFEHPRDNRRYFYFYNTIHKVVETIPMGLADFVWYYLSDKDSATGLDDVYNQLITKGPYLFDDEFIKKSKEEKQMLYALVESAGTHGMSKVNEKTSARLDTFFTTRVNEDLLIGTTKIFQESKFVPYRSLDFFATWHGIFEYFRKNQLVEDPNFSLRNLMMNENECDLDGYSNYFLDLMNKNKCPFTIIPHVLRKHKLIQDFFIRYNYQGLLPFYKGELLYEKKQYTFRKKIPNEEELNIFLSIVSNCNYGIADNLKSALEIRNKNLDDLSFFEKKDIFKDLLFNEVNLVNLLDEDGKELLPPIYSDCLFQQNDKEDFFIFFKYGIQALDLYNKYGKLLYEEAYDYYFMGPFVIVTEQSMELKILKFSDDKESLYLISELKETNDYETQVLSKEGEGKFFFMNGFINENFELQSPFCFDKNKSFIHIEKTYSEGLAPVSLNGKWGYIDHSSNIVIPFEYGDAFPFKDGKAKVFKLKEEFNKTIGIWKEIPSNEIKLKQFNLTTEQFKKKFPSFPKFVSKPLAHFRKTIYDQFQLIMNYYSFEDGIVSLENENWDVSYFGKWIYIDKQGRELGDVLFENRIEQKKIIPANYSFKSEDKNQWLELISKNNYEVNNLPDRLYLDKEFILRLIENSPGCYMFLNYLYIDDQECIAIYLEAMKQLKNGNQSNLNLIEEDDDLPL